MVGWYSSHTIIADDAAVQNEETAIIKCGSEIIPGSNREGQHLSALMHDLYRLVL